MDKPLQSRMDEFSAQFSLHDDSRFWLRIERPFEDELRITDALPGAQSADRVAALMKIAFDEIGTTLPCNLRFVNVSGGDPEAAAGRIDLLKRLGTAYGSLVGRMSRFETLVDAQGKTDLCMRLAAGRNSNLRRVVRTRSA